MADLNIVPPPPPGDDVKLKAAEVYRFGEERMRALSSAMIERMQLAQQAGMTYGSKRDLYELLGYNATLTAREYGERYARGGLAGRIVDVYPNATWRGDVEVYEDDDPKVITKFEQAWLDFDRQHQVKAKLLRADKLSLLSTYSVLLIGARDSLDTELPRGVPGKVLYLTPYAGGGGPGRGKGFQQHNSRTSGYDADVTVYELEDDSESPRFGLPRTYQLRREETTGGQVASALPRTVHWSRIIHIAENVLWDEIYGLPALERVWNLLDDLEKVTGGGAEAFWLRANQGMHLDIDKDMALPDTEAAVAALKSQAEDYKHQLTRWLRTRGVSVTPLGSDVANFSSPADAIITQIAGAKGIPKRILTGSEMGELASSQDRENWKDQVNGRQTQHAGPYIIRPLVDRLIHYGYLPSPVGGPDVYKIEWPHIQVLTEEERAAGAQQWASVNSTQGEIVFTNDEMRDHWYGFAPLTTEQKKPPEPPAPPAPPPGAKGQVDENGQPVEPVEPKAEDRELLAVLEAAIASNNTEVIDMILGTSHSREEA